MIQPKRETEGFLISITKNCETLIKKILEKQKKHWDLNSTNQDKHFILNHQSQLKDPGRYN